MPRRMKSCSCNISNALGMCSESSRFESRQKLRLSWLKHFISLCKKVRDGTCIRRQPVTSKRFPIHHSSIVLTFEALLCDINTNRSASKGNHGALGTIFGCFCPSIQLRADTDKSSRNLVVTECPVLFPFNSMSWPIEAWRAYRFVIRKTLCPFNPSLWIHIS